jgi:hypothetical protein
MALQTNTTLAQLDLGGNKLGAESGKAMAEALKTNTALTQLGLTRNKLGDAGGCALAVALQTNTTLAQLDLDGNELGTESGEASDRDRILPYTGTRYREYNPEDGQAAPRLQRIDFYR